MRRLLCFVSGVCLMRCVSHAVCVMRVLRGVCRVYQVSQKSKEILILHICDLRLRYVKKYLKYVKTDLKCVKKDLENYYPCTAPHLFQKRCNCLIQCG